MGAYRLYFLNESGRVIASDVFDAARDHEATEMAVLLADACADACCGYELWQAHRKIAGQIPINGGITAKTAAHMNEATQNAVIDREERIQRSRSRVSESRRLLAKLDAARKERIAAT